MISVRVATVSDAGSMLKIYSPYVIGTAFSFETELPTLDQFRERVKLCLEKYPWLVCSLDGEVAGYVYASKHREREAYQWTCESSVYIADDFKGKGIGRALYGVLFTILQLQGFRNVYAGITQPNEPSEKLHAKCGFELFALYENIGYKLGRWHNVGWWKLQLNGYDLKPPPPIKFSEVNNALLADIFLEAALRVNSGYGGLSANNDR
jgi:L-amino acid N-acyltransferase YncA